MLVCVSAKFGYFFRINTKAPKTNPSIILSVQLHSAFLRYDSHLQCAPPLVLDEYVIESANYLGVIDSSLLDPLIETVQAARVLSPSLKLEILGSLQDYKARILNSR